MVFSVCATIAGVVVGWFIPEVVTAFSPNKVIFPWLINLGMAFVGGVVAYGIFG